jgi:hypothetical protein
MGEAGSTYRILSKTALKDIEKQMRKKILGFVQRRWSLLKVTGFN